MVSDDYRAEISSLIRDYYRKKWIEEKREFIPGVDWVLTNARVFDSVEIETLVDAALDFWLTSGRYSEKFELGLENFLNVREAILCNSGSSANLLAISALTSRELSPLGGWSPRLEKDDEIITVAAGFPTTVGGVIQNGLVPVFLDIELDTYNIDVRLLEEARTDRTRAVMLAHTLGHPFDLRSVLDFCDRHDLWLIEDNCDALGSQYGGKYTGTFGNLATQSFFPAHHITTGQGGAVLIRHPKIAKIIRSFRDWGRDCWCLPGHENTCGKRYDWRLDELPDNYDHKYIYTHIGYNLEMTDLQAAIGCAQLEKLPRFIEARKRNWHLLHDRLTDIHGIDEFFVFPKMVGPVEPSWFGFALRVRQGASFSRFDAIRYLRERKIDAKFLFAGDLTKQPAYRNVEYRIVGDLKNTDDAMENTFWLGVYPGITQKMIDYVAEAMDGFVKEHK